MQSAPPSTAVGIDLGSATTTVMVRRSGDRSAANIVDPVPDQLTAGGTFSAALVVPASWDDDQRADHIEAAARAGFDRIWLVPEPEAAARYYTEIEERELDPDTPLIVYNLGAESCNVGIVSVNGDEYEIHAAADADDVGGRRFDEILLEYLADWHRSTSPAFWLRIDAFGPNSERTALLDQIRVARERLTTSPTATIDIPGRELTITRAELDSVIAETVAQTADLAERTLDTANVGPSHRAELLLIGGASRTPLVIQTLRERLGIDPFVPEMPDLAAAEGAALAAADGPVQLPLAAAPVAARKRPRKRSRRPVLALVLVLAAALVAAGTVTAYQLLTDPPVDAGGAGGGEATAEDDDRPSLQPTDPEPSDTGENTGEEAPGPTPEPDPGPGDDTEPTPDGSEDSSAAPTPTDPDGQETSTGTVPDVVGLTLSEARGTLIEAGFDDIPDDGYRRTGNEYSDCEVTQQSPQGGRERPLDEPISLTYVYVGKDGC